MLLTSSWRHARGGKVQSCVRCGDSAARGARLALEIGEFSTGSNFQKWFNLLCPIDSLMFLVFFCASCCVDLSYQSYLKSSILGHPAAKINLGNLYYQGKGTSKSYEKAMKSTEKNFQLTL